MAKPKEPLSTFKELISEIETCNICRAQLPFEPKPILQVNPKARLLIVGQAPGRKAHESGKPFDDASGNRLREWMGVNRELFYCSDLIAIIPMGFCFPGTGKAGDLPPRSECAHTWRSRLMAQLPSLETTLVIGQYAQNYHLEKKYQTVTEAVNHWRNSWPKLVPLPHPSPRNNLWLKRNPWFEEKLVPVLKKRISSIISE